MQLSTRHPRAGGDPVLYMRGNFWHTNTVENYFSILKRGIVGTYLHVSQQHLIRYVGEFDFHYNNRKITDSERAEIVIKEIDGKRLMYQGAGKV